MLPCVEASHAPPTRLEAARLAHALCTRTVLTRQMFVACQGLPALVKLLLQPTANGPLVLLGIDAVKAVLDMEGASRNDLCRTFAELEVLELLVHAMHAINREHAAHAGRAAEILLLFSCADPVVKARMATRRVLPGLMQVLAAPEDFEPTLSLKVAPLPPPTHAPLPAAVPSPSPLLTQAAPAAPPVPLPAADPLPSCFPLAPQVLRCLKHLCMGDAKHMDELQRAKARPRLSPRPRAATVRR